MQRARAWVTSQDPLDTIISGPDGNPNTSAFTSHGCPVFSGGESDHVEKLLITAHPVVLAWLQEVALTDNYTNPFIAVDYADVNDLPPEPDWSQWRSTEGDLDVEKQQIQERGEIATEGDTQNQDKDLGEEYITG